MQLKLVLGENTWKTLYNSLEKEMLFPTAERHILHSADYCGLTVQIQLLKKIHKSVITIF